MSGQMFWGADGAGVDMVTGDNAKFQMDGNMGAIAAMVEALVHR